MISHYILQCNNGTESNLW